MVAPLGRHYGRRISQMRKIWSQLWTWKIVVVKMLGNTEISRVVTSMSPWAYRWNFTVWKKIKSHLQSQKKIGTVITSLGFSTKVRPHKYKKARYSIRNATKKDLSKIIREFENFLIKVMRGRGLNMRQLKITFTYQDQLWSVWWELMPSNLTFTL